MNGAVYETTMNVFFKIKHAKLYDAVLSTPMTPADVALGEIGWAVARGFIYSIAFLVTMWALGMTGSPWVVLSLPICVLIGFAFGGDGHGLDDVHAVVGRLRVRHGGDAAAVPVLGHLLPGVELRRAGPGWCS